MHFYLLNNAVAFFSPHEHVLEAPRFSAPMGCYSIFKFSIPLNTCLVSHPSANCSQSCFFLSSFFSPGGSFFGGSVSLLPRFYSILIFSINFNIWMASHPSANCGPSCLTWVILRELMFPTWYSIFLSSLLKRTFHENTVLKNLLYALESRTQKCLI